MPEPSMPSPLRRQLREELMRSELERAHYELGVYRAIVEAVARGDADAVTRLLPAARLALAQRTRRGYTPSTRRIALRLVALVGASAVSRRYGIRLRTIQSWCARAGVSSRGLYAPRRRRRHRSWAAEHPAYVAMLERRDDE